MTTLYTFCRHVDPSTKAEAFGSGTAHRSTSNQILWKFVEVSRAFGFSRHIALVIDREGL